MKRWWPLLAGVAVTPFAILIGFISGGAGHGEYVLARLLLPWASELTGIGNFSPWHGTAVVSAALAQWPLYGLVIALRRECGWAVLAAHLGMVIWLFTLGNHGFGLH